MLKPNSIAASGFPDCPDEAEGGRDEGRFVPLCPVHVQGNILVGTGGGNGLPGTNSRGLQLLCSPCKAFIVPVSDEVRLRGAEDLRGSLGGVDSKQEGVVLDEMVEGVL